MRRRASGSDAGPANRTIAAWRLSDVGDRRTSEGNHGWGTLADNLEGRGYSVSQVVEPSTGRPAAWRKT